MKFEKNESFVTERRFGTFNSHHSAWQYTAKKLKVPENRA